MSKCEFCGSGIDTREEYCNNCSAPLSTRLKKYSKEYNRKVTIDLVDKCWLKYYELAKSNIDKIEYGSRLGNGYYLLELNDVTIKYYHYGFQVKTRDGQDIFVDTDFYINGYSISPINEIEILRKGHSAKLGEGINL